MFSILFLLFPNCRIKFQLELRRVFLSGSLRHLIWCRIWLKFAFFSFVKLRICLELCYAAQLVGGSNGWEGLGLGLGSHDLYWIWAELCAVAGVAGSALFEEPHLFGNWANICCQTRSIDANNCLWAATVARSVTICLSVNKPND